MKVSAKALEIIPTIENTNVEFKELDRRSGKLPDKIMHEVVAFLNTDGGDIYIGIRDDQTIAGVEAPDDVMTRLSSTIGDGILPNAMPFIRIDPIEMEGKWIIKCSVAAGVEKPYFLRNRGLTPEGVYIRVGAACRNVNENAIRQMIMESSGKAYEECRSLNQNLTFETMKVEMAKRALAFDEPQMKTLKMIGDDGLFTNLALLLSDQCPFVTKIAIFDGELFRDRQVFTGSLLKQLNDAYHLLNLNNKTAATFQELLRTDVRDYPPDALREALLNSIVHRSYTLSEGNIINIRDDRVEVISLGGLVPDISFEAIFLGISQSRNPNLAAVFYRLRLIESYGTGIRKIIARYAAYEAKPEFRTAEGAFRVDLPNVNFGKSRIKVSESKEEYTVPAEPKVMEDRVLELIRAKEIVTRKEVETELGVGTTKAYTVLKQLCEMGQIEQLKKGRMTVYKMK